MKLNSLAVLSLLIFCYPTLYAQECDVIWQDLRRTSVNGTTLTKISGGSSWNADARSVQTIAANSDGYVIYEIGTNDGSPNLGLNAVNSSASFGDLDYRLFFAYNVSHNSRYVESKLNGVSNNIGSYGIGDRFRIRRTGSKIYVDKQLSGTSNWSALDSASALLSGQLPELFADVSLIYVNTSKTSNAKIYCPVLNSYGTPLSTLNSSFYRCQNGELKLLLNEDYDHENDLLSITILDPSNQVIYQPTTLLKSTGINRYSMDLSATGVFTDGEYYTLVVEDLKKRKTYLRLQYND